MGSLYDKLPISKVKKSRLINQSSRLFVASIMMAFLSIVILFICSTYCLVISQF